MENQTNDKIKRTGLIVLIIALVLILGAIPVFAWFYLQREIAAYAPISSPESLYIGAGHYDLETGHFEDIRYMYFDAMEMEAYPDPNDGYYWDRVFCVYGKMVPGYRLQLAYTTNNQFTYEIFNATEWDVDNIESWASDKKDAYDAVKATAVDYTTHDEHPENYAYTVNGAKLAGNYLNIAAVSELLANASLHTSTYGAYSSVQKYAEPLYWQTTAKQNGNSRGDFVNYYILRVRSAEEVDYDRETDIICISAKSFSA